MKKEPFMKTLIHQTGVVLTLFLLILGMITILGAAMAFAGLYCIGGLT